jgi:hypothetical protein
MPEYNAALPRLPAEVVKLIFFHLRAVDLVAAGLGCKQWQLVSKSNDLWAERCRADMSERFEALTGSAGKKPAGGAPAAKPKVGKLSGVIWRDVYFNEMRARLSKRCQLHPAHFIRHQHVRQQQ